MPTLSDVDGAFARYRPGAPAEGWTEPTKLFVHGAVTKAAPRNPRDAYRLIAVTAPYVLWGLGNGIALNPEQLFTPDRLEEYLASGSRARWVHGTQVSVRWALRRIGVANTRRAPWKPTSKIPGSKTVTYPYTEEQIRLYWDASTKQSTDRRSRYMRASLAFQHGAGLHNVELLHLRTTDLEFRGTHWVVHLTAHHTAESHCPARLTPVAAAYSAAVSQLVEEAQGGLLATSRPTTLDAIKGIRNHLEYSARLPAFSSRRLRATWLSSALNRPVPLRAVLDAAGLTTLDLTAIQTTLRNDNVATHLAAIAGIVIDSADTAGSAPTHLTAQEQR